MFSEWVAVIINEHSRQQQFAGAKGKAAHVWNQGPETFNYLRRMGQQCVGSF